MGTEGQHELYKLCTAGEQPACAAFDREMDANRRTYGPRLARIASSFCLETEGAANVTHVALRMRTVGIVPWSEPQASTPPSEATYDFGVHPLARDVARTGLYLAENHP